MVVDLLLTKVYHNSKLCNKLLLNFVAQTTATYLAHNSSSQQFGWGSASQVWQQWGLPVHL
jgi:hypothetical protein